MQKAEAESDKRGDMVVKLMADVEERSNWALRLNEEIEHWKALDRHLDQINQELEDRTAWALNLKAQLENLSTQFEERTNWALELDRQLNAHTIQNAELTKSLDQLAWAKPFDRRFHNFLTALVRRLTRHP